MDVNTKPKPPPFNNIYCKHKHTSSLGLSIITTKTSMAGESRNPGEQVYRRIAPGCEGFEGREQTKCISRTLTTRENRALILVCMKVRERGSSPFAGDYQALHSATGMPGMLGRLCSEPTGSALH